jgi:hypothetical protein
MMKVDAVVCQFGAIVLALQAMMQVLRRNSRTAWHEHFLAFSAVNAGREDEHPRSWFANKH